MRHAWLIIAHNEFGVLQKLVSMLDDGRSDFYVHIDRKVAALPELHVEKGRLTFLQKRIDVSWGTVSQIRTELLLLDTALKNGPYAHYHILSGTHLPLRPVEELLDYYDSHAQEEIMRFWKPNEGDADFKLRRYHFPMRHFKVPGHAFCRAVETFIWRAALKVQKVFGIRHLRHVDFRKTDNWMSLTERGARFLVDNRARILRKYRWSFCGDEYFAATELCAEKDRFDILDDQQLLYVEFLGDTPRSFAVDAYPRLQETRYLWARKFSMSHEG